MSATARLSVLTCVLWLVPVAVAAQKKGCNPDDLFCDDPSVAITPDGAASGAWNYTTANAIVFTVRNIGLGGQSIELACVANGKASNCQLSATIVNLSSGQSTNVTAWYDAGAPGSGTVFLTGTPGGPGAGDQGYYSVSVSPGPPPNISVNNYEPRRMDYGMCLNACFAATYAQSTVPYFSLDTPRSVTLVYNEDRTSNKPFVYAEVSHSNPAYPPTQYQLRVKINGVYRTFVNGESLLRFSYPGEALHLLGGQLADVSNLSTGAYVMSLEVTSVFPTGTATSVATRHLVVLDERNSTVARGWSVGGLQRLYSNATGVVIAEGDGSYTHFVWSNGVLTAPDGDFTRVTDTGPANAKWVRFYPDSTTATFNSAGRLVEVRDAFDNVTTFGYDGSNRLTTVTDPVGKIITLAYGSYGLASITDPFGRVTLVTVDASRRLTAVKDPDNKSTGFGYDAQLRLRTITDRRSKTTTLTYDPLSGRLASVIAPPVTIYQLGSQSLTTRFSSFQTSGVPYASTAFPFQPVPHGLRVATVTAPNGIVTTYRGFNKHGQAGYTLLPYGVQIVTSHNADGQLIGVNDPTAGGTATYWYDGSGFLTHAKVQGRDTWRRNGGWGRADSVWTTETAARIFLRPPTGRVDSMRVGSGGAPATRYTYTSRGQVTSVTDPMGHLVSSTSYTGTNGNRSSVTEAGNRVTTFGYDQYGRLKTVTAPGFPTVTTTYDVLNRQRQVIRGGSVIDTTVYTYDNLFLTSVTDPKGQVYSFTTNDLGWPVRQIDPTGAFVESAYGLNGEVRRQTNRRGQSIYMAYDSLLRVTARWGDNLDSVSFQLDAVGNTVTGRSTWSVETAYRSATTGLVDSVKTVLPMHSGRTFYRRYGYRADGVLAFIGSAGSALTLRDRGYSYFSWGALFSVTFGGLSTIVDRDWDALPDTIIFPGPWHNIYQTFTSLHRPSAISSAATGTQRYAYEPEQGRLWANWDFSDGTGRATTYDERGRVDGVTYERGNWGACLWVNLYDFGWWCSSGTVDSSRVLTYDAVGNRTDLGGQYDLGNRITAFRGCWYTYDADGNVTARGGCAATTTFTWDALNRLVRTTTQGVDRFYYYDAFGRLVRRAQAGSGWSSYYLWDRANLFAELNYNATAIKGEYSYYPGADRLHAFAKGNPLARGNQIYYAHTDGLGNVRALTDSMSTLAATYKYEVGGSNAGTTNPAGLGDNQRARFKGALRMDDGLELYYMRNRWYEPHSGRFLSEDPIGLEGGINPYVFAGADPVNRHDPSGLDDCQEGQVLDEHGHCVYEMAPIGTTAEAGPLVSEIGMAGALWNDFWRGQWSPGIYGDGTLFGLALRDRTKRRATGSENAFGAFLEGGSVALEIYIGGSFSELRGCPPRGHFNAPAWINRRFQTVQVAIHRMRRADRRDEHGGHTLSSTAYYRGAVDAKPFGIGIQGSVWCTIGYGTFWRL